MEFESNKSAKRQSNKFQHDSVLLRTPSARRRRKNQNSSETVTPKNVQNSENMWPMVDKCLICRNSECFGNKCCEFLNSSRRSSCNKSKNMKKSDQSSSPVNLSKSPALHRSFQGVVESSLQTSQVAHNQESRGQGKDDDHHHYHNKNHHQHPFHRRSGSSQRYLPNHQQNYYCRSTKKQSNERQQFESFPQSASAPRAADSTTQIDGYCDKITESKTCARWTLSRFNLTTSKCSMKYKFWRTLACKISHSLIWFAISLFLVNFSISLIISGEYAKEIKPRLRSTGKVCSSMDIRNNPKEFNNLTECSVIEGILIISLMDKYSAQDYETLSFPLLTEVTDHIVIYRINGLKTLGRLFPNLSVIRGNVLFEGYALVIYENTHLEEIGLTSLTTIKRGAVRIEKNPLLCFVETIDWSQIAINTSVENHFFRNNKNVNECPSCPGGNSKSDRGDDGGQIEETKSCMEYPGRHRYCWNRQHCQKICPARCKTSCNERKECCNESCLGGCATDNVNLCNVCKHLVHGKECTDTCPAGSYKFLERSCVSAQDCHSKLPPLNTDMRDEYPYVPFQGVCSTRCPQGYEKFNNETCRRCDDKCIKKCPPSSLDSIADAMRLRGCTHISGPLIISIRKGGSHIMEDLESALSSIEEIDGYLKVTRSFSLLSLSFLKGLKVIRGKEKDSGKYALYVIDNQNLQNIWGDNQTVRIEDGRIFFHFNPKLCYYKIENLRSMMVRHEEFDPSEVAPDSNGQRGFCNITTLNVTITNIGPRAAIVKLEPMKFEDERGFIGYQYYYIEAPYRNVSIFDSRHGCDNDGWNLDDVTNKDETHHIFTHLQPYTQYAFYVRTYTISSVRNNGQSPILYFRTLPGKPERVRNLKSIKNSSSEIIVKWSPPKVANGNLTGYEIKANLTLDDPKILEQRNYCEEPIKDTFEVPIIHPSEKDTSLADKDAKDCMCENNEGGRPNKPVNKIEEEVVENVIEFEDAIQNYVYVKRDDLREKENVRRKRDLKNITVTTPDTSTDSNDRVFPDNDRPKHSDEGDSGDVVSKKDGTFFTVFHVKVNASINELVLKDLKHYSTYTISVKACREGKEADRCSNEAITYSRTAKLVGADDVENLKVDEVPTNTSRSDVRLKWDPPKDPNSLIVSYSIRYARADIEHAKGVDQCITQREYANLTYFTITNLETGNYSFQVMATSLAGDGNYTAPVYYNIRGKSFSLQVILGLSLTALLLFILIGVLIWYIRKKYVATVPDLKLFTSVNPEYVSMHYTPDEWEIPRDKIIQIRELGQGSFGMVYEGIVKNLNKIEEDTPCAIKTVNESATDRERINFLKEAGVMKEFDTHHVVRLLGVCSRGQPTLVVMELMKYGDLKAYLRSHRPDVETLQASEPPPQPPTLKRILQMAIEIADGMAYLSAKKFVHRDLAARNCMVAADLTVKIGDFGMTRDIYETDYYRKGTKGLLPVRWMAPESLKDGVFSSASDVFSYGVVLWEMATLASQPYQGLSNDQVLRYVIDGGVMERPENCPDKLYNLMRKCWQHRPTSRPTFMDIIQILLDDADPKFREVSFYHSQEGQDLLAQMQPPTDLDDVTTPLRVGDDDFKMEIEDNYLNNSKHSRRSHLAATEGQPHSPFSFGSAILTSSTPGAASSLKHSTPTSLSSSLKQEQQQKEQHLQQKQYPEYSDASNRQQPTTVAAAAVSATPATTDGISPAIQATGTVQNFINSLSVAPRSRRMEFLKKTFLGNGSNSNNSRYNSGGNGGGNNILRSTGGIGTGGISTIETPNEYNSRRNGSNSRKSSKDYKILDESVTSHDDTNIQKMMPTRTSSTFYNNEQPSLPSLFSLDNERTQKLKQQQNQCNELDRKVINSRSNSTKLSNSTRGSNSSSEDVGKISTTASPPYQFQQQPHHEKQQINKHPKETGGGTSLRSHLQQPNGYIIASPQTDYSFSQDYQEGVPEEQKLLTRSHK